MKKLLWLNLAVTPWCLADSPTVIPEVALTAANPANTEVYPGESITLNHEQLQASPDNSLSTVLKTQSVVRVANNSGNEEQLILSIRGFGDNAQANSLITVDGFPLINSSLFAPNFNAIMLSDIQTMILFPGSQGSLWGNQAVGGVMSIDTRQPQHPYGAVNVSYGSYATPFVSGLYGDKLANGFFYKVSAFGTTTNNYREHADQSNQGVSLQQGWDYATGTWLFNEKFTDDTVQFSGALSQAQYEQNPQQATDSQDYIRYKTQTYQILNKQLVNNHWHVETRFSTTAMQSGGWFMGSLTGYESLNWFNPQLVGTYHGQKWTFGYVAETSHYQEITGATDNTSIADSSENDLYGRSVLPLSAKWDMTLGARAAWQNNQPQLTLGQVTPYSNRVLVTEQGLNYHVSNALTWFLRRDGNFRLPKTNEEVWLPTNVTELKAQTGVSYETGLLWQSLKQKAQISVYELWLHNELAYDPTQTPTQPFGATSNFDTTLRKGLSVSQETQVTNKIAVNSQVNYVDAHFVHGPYSGKAVPGVPKYNAGLGGAYQFTSAWRAGYNESYTGTAVASNDIANVAPKASAYWLGQCFVQYALKDMKVNFQINNLFDQRYATYTVYNQSSGSNSYYPGAGRSYTLSVKAEWA